METLATGLFSNKLVLTHLENSETYEEGGDGVRRLNHFSPRSLEVSFLKLSHEGGINDESEKERRSSRNL
jgi:hypothetical protein